MLSTILILSLALVASKTEVQENPQNRVKIEFRLAESSPSEGLQEVSIEGTSEKLYVRKEVIVSNKDVVAARPIPSLVPNSFDIEIEFSDEGAKKISKATTENLGKRIAILIDGKAIVAPVVRSTISKKAVIAGSAPSFTRDEAENLARKIVAP
jgi:preprotein translocase subunit SecD